MRRDWGFDLILEQGKTSGATGTEWMCFAFYKDMNFVALGAESYGLNVCPPNSYVKILMPDETVFVGGAFRRCLHYEGDVLINETSAL